MGLDYIHGYSKLEFERLIEQARILGPGVYDQLDLSIYSNLLEIGCGVGAQTKEILKRWPSLKISSVEKNKNSFESARNYLVNEIKSGGVEIFNVNAENLPFKDESFDLAITIWVLEHIKKPKKILTEAKRVLRPGGKLIMTEVDNSTFKFIPENTLIHNWWSKFNTFQKSTGADPYIGKRLESMALELGFVEVTSEYRTLVSSRLYKEKRLELLRYCRDLLLSGATNMLDANLVSKEEIENLKLEFLRLEKDNSVDFQYLSVRVVAQKENIILI